MRSFHDTRRVGRRPLLAFAVAVVGCGREVSAPTRGTSSPSGAGRPSAGGGASGERPAESAPRLELAWHDLSVFHGDGERMAFRSDGYALYERMRQDALLRWEGTLDADVVAKMRGVAARFAGGLPEVPSRPGIPDEVHVTAHYRDASGALVDVGMWANDLGKLPPGHPIHELRGLVRLASEGLVKRAQGTPAKADDSGARWPRVFEPPVR